VLLEAFDGIFNARF